MLVVIIFLVGFSICWFTARGGEVTSQLEAAVPTSEPTSTIEAREATCFEESLWTQDTEYKGYGLSPIGGLIETRWIVGETWRADPNTGEVLESYVFLIPPGTIAWLTNHTGGSAWGLCVDSEEAAVVVGEQHVNNLIDRDGIKPTLIVLPQDAEGFGVLDHLQTEAVGK
ncbi:MAG: hypothetical protein P8Y17_02890 [Patescibacteria group bacterium]